MTLEVAVQKEDRRIEPRRTNFESKNPHRPGLVLVAFQELEPDLVVEQAGGLVAEIGVGERAEGLLEGGLGVPWIGSCLIAGSLNSLLGKLVGRQETSQPIKQTEVIVLGSRHIGGPYRGEPRASCSAP